MSERPPSVRLDDLADPRYSDDVRAMLAFMEDAGSRLALQPAELEQAAKDETGLNDFGASDFEPRLELLCRAMREQGGFNSAGVLQQHTFLTGLLKNRLLIEDLITRHPEILDEQIRAPIIICGLPRTGTTHLHNLMSADPALRSLPYWESLEPVLGERERSGPGGPDPRPERTVVALEFLDTALPYFNRMHEMTVEHAHEEIQLLAIDFSSMLFETTAPMPLWRDGYLARDQRPSYAYLVRVLRVLQWLRGGTRWVLKSPQHLEQFPVLVDTFPDATFVVTHRDPVSVTVSMATMLAYSARLTRDRVDVEGIGRYWSDRLERMLRQSVADHDALPAERTIDVQFDEFMADDVAMVQRVYDVAGQPMDERSRAAMSAFMAQHPRGRFGTVEYDLSPFGLDRDELRRSLAFYTERFGVKMES
jgi:Sulfotransferase family